MQVQPTSNTPADIIWLKFADSKVPDFKEVTGKDFIYFGEDNGYPDHLLHLFNKSSKHGAIINGKVNYVYGKGLKTDDQRGQQLITSCNRYGESLNEVAMKCILDIEVFGGYYLQVVYNNGGQMAELYHMPFQNIRMKKDRNGWLYKKDWTNNRLKASEYDSFNPNQPTASQIFAYKEYRPGTDIYPLPGYMASINYIETDIEISKYWLSSIRNGMFPSKMIVFNNGEPSEEGKREIEKKLKQKFTGAEQSGNVLIVFQNDPAKAPIIQDLSATDLDKQFTLLNETVMQEIFSGHSVTSPALFGISTPGKLGETTTLEKSFEIFKNTYAEIKQRRFEESFNYITSFMGVVEGYELQPVDPIGFSLSEAALLQIAPKDWLLEKAGIDVTQYQPAAAPGAPAADQAMTNENLRNLTGRQYQQVMRVVREFTKGKLNREQASLMLKGGLGLTDGDVDTLLGVSGEQFNAVPLPYSEEQVADMFAECGEEREQFVVIDSWELEPDAELKFYQSFAEVVSVTEANVIDLIRKDKRITPEVIAQTLKVSREWAARKVADLVARGVIEQRAVTVGSDTIIEREPVRSAIVDMPKAETTEVLVRYTYEVKPGVGPAIISTTRPFCKKLIQLDRMYNRSDIEQITQRLGYSVWDRAGGFWTQPDGTAPPSCRHYWKTNVIIKKKQ